MTAHIQHENKKNALSCAATPTTLLQHLRALEMIVDNLITNVIKVLQISSTNMMTEAVNMLHT